MDEDEKAFRLYAVYKAYEEHENDLLNHRTGWLVAVQSVLLATFGFSLQKYYEVVETTSAQRESSLATLVSASTSVPKNQASVVEAINAALKTATDESLKSADLTDHYRVFLLVLAGIGLVTSAIAYVSINAAIIAQTAIRYKWTNEHMTAAASFGLPDIAGGGTPEAARDGGVAARLLPMLLAALWVGIFIFVLVRKAELL